MRSGIFFIIAMSKIRNKKEVIKKLKKRGVKVYGNDVLISAEAVIEDGATLFSPCTILGGSHICRGAKVYPNSYLDGAYVGANVCVYASTIVNSRVEEGSIIGPYAHLCDGADIGRNCFIGDFVEINRSSVGGGSKVARLAYVGDAEIGKNVSVGSGVIFADFQGKRKFSTVVEDGCFIGRNCNLIAPSRIRSGAYIAAATTVCGEVCEGSFCVGRSKPKMVKGGASGRYVNG